MYCLKCGRAQRGDPTFCRNCGEKIKLLDSKSAFLSMEGLKKAVCIFSALILIIVVSLGMKSVAKSVQTPNLEQTPVLTATPAMSGVQLRGMGELYGVIIGIGDYAYIDDLYVPDDGAKKIHSQLEDIWGNQTHLKLLLNKDATRDDIGNAMSWLTLRENAEDTVLFYLTGHGNENYLSSYDSRPDSYANDIPVSLLDRWLDSLDSEKVVVVLDSCRSGAYAQKLSQSGRVIISSCAANEDSYAYNDLSNYIIQALSEPEITDTDVDNQISAEEIYAYVARQHIPNQHPCLFDSDPSELVLVSIGNR